MVINHLLTGMILQVFIQIYIVPHPKGVTTIKDAPDACKISILTHSEPRPEKKKLCRKEHKMLAIPVDEFFQ